MSSKSSAKTSKGKAASEDPGARMASLRTLSKSSTVQAGNNGPPVPVASPRSKSSPSVVVSGDSEPPTLRSGTTVSALERFAEWRAAKSPENRASAAGTGGAAQTAGAANGKNSRGMFLDYDLESFLHASDVDPAEIEEIVAVHQKRAQRRNRVLAALASLLEGSGMMSNDSPSSSLSSSISSSERPFMIVSSSILTGLPRAIKQYWTLSVQYAGAVRTARTEDDDQAPQQFAQPHYMDSLALCGPALASSLRESFRSLLRSLVRLMAREDNAGVQLSAMSVCALNYRIEKTRGANRDAAMLIEAQERPGRAAPLSSPMSLLRVLKRLMLRESASDTKGETETAAESKVSIAHVTKAARDNFKFIAFTAFRGGRSQSAIVKRLRDQVIDIILSQLSNSLPKHFHMTRGERRSTAKETAYAQSSKPLSIDLLREEDECYEFLDILFRICAQDPSHLQFDPTSSPTASSTASNTPTHTLVRLYRRGSFRIKQLSIRILKRILVLRPPTSKLAATPAVTGPSALVTSGHVAMFFLEEIGRLLSASDADDDAADKRRKQQLGEGLFPRCTIREYWLGGCALKVEGTLRVTRGGFWWQPPGDVFRKLLTDYALVVKVKVNKKRPSLKICISGEDAGIILHFADKKTRDAVEKLVHKYWTEEKAGGGSKNGDEEKSSDTTEAHTHVAIWVYMGPLSEPDQWKRNWKLLQRAVIGCNECWGCSQSKQHKEAKHSLWGRLCEMTGSKADHSTVAGGRKWGDEDGYYNEKIFKEAASVGSILGRCHSRGEPLPQSISLHSGTKEGREWILLARVPKHHKYLGSGVSAKGTG